MQLAKNEGGVGKVLTQLKEFLGSAVNHSLMGSRAEGSEIQFFDRL